MRTINLLKFVLIGLLMSVMSACYDVEDGYRINYAESTAQFSVTPATVTRGAVGDTLRFTILAKAETDIKSVIVTSSLSGKEGTGFVVDSGKTDPLIDHTYGTIQKNTRQLELVYKYIVAQDSDNVMLTFSMIDGDGKKSASFEVFTVPSITSYSHVILYTNSASKTDGFSTADGTIYRALANYEAVTTVNQAVQESLDFIFLVSNGSALLAGPYDGNFSTNMKIRNKTKFKLLTDITTAAFDSLTPATLSYLVDLGKVDKGTTSISGIKVGDFIGYKTDFASTNSYKYGIIRVNAIHPSNCSWYDGVSYLIDMDVVSQINKE
ncbi:MAG: hypothetical protein Q8914_01830 [Bacteroidota bacterium]|nr:hypothetical protein [Bacteroidota bacterium]